MRILGVAFVVSVVLVACGPSLEAVSAVDVEPVGSVEAAASNVTRPGLNSCEPGEFISGYGCNSSITTIPCSPYNVTGCNTASLGPNDNYRDCSETECQAKYVVTFYEKTTSCRTDGLPSVRTGCYHPASTTTYIGQICGSTCPNGLTATPKGYNAACDLDCQKGTGSCSTVGRASNSVQCS